VRRMRTVYATRREVLLAALKRDFSRWLEPIPSIAGLHLAAFARPSVDAPALADLARRHDVGVSSLRGFYAGGPARHGFAFGYGAIDEQSIVEACSRLRQLWPK
jgi:GntR family transcriptional regulator / MocR family aminotransferase